MTTEIESQQGLFYVFIGSLVIYWLFQIISVLSKSTNTLRRNDGPITKGEQSDAIETWYNQTKKLSRMFAPVTVITRETAVVWYAVASVTLVQFYLALHEDKYPTVESRSDPEDPRVLYHDSSVFIIPVFCGTVYNFMRSLLAEYQDGDDASAGAKFTNRLLTQAPNLLIAAMIALYEGALKGAITWKARYLIIGGVMIGAALIKVISFFVVPISRQSDTNMKHLRSNLATVTWRSYYITVNGFDVLIFGLYFVMYVLGLIWAYDPNYWGDFGGRPHLVHLVNLIPSVYLLGFSLVGFFGSPDGVNSQPLAVKLFNFLLGLTMTFTAIWVPVALDHFGKHVYISATVPLMVLLFGLAMGLCWSNPIYYPTFSYRCTLGDTREAAESGYCGKSNYPNNY